MVLVALQWIRLLLGHGCRNGVSTDDSTIDREKSSATGFRALSFHKPRHLDELCPCVHSVACGLLRRHMVEHSGRRRNIERFLSPSAPVGLLGTDSEEGPAGRSFLP